MFLFNLKIRIFLWLKYSWAWVIKVLYTIHAFVPILASVSFNKNFIVNQSIHGVSVKKINPSDLLSASKSFLHLGLGDRSIFAFRIDIWVNLPGSILNFLFAHFITVLWCLPFIYPSILKKGMANFCDYFVISTCKLLSCPTCGSMTFLQWFIL